MKRPKNSRLRRDIALSPKNEIDKGDGNKVTRDLIKELPKLIIDDDGMQEPFERMNVQVTIYALSGIIRGRNNPLSARKLGRDKKKSVKSGSSDASSSGFRHRSNSDSKSNLKRNSATDIVESPNHTFEADVPTTAVVSVHREVMSSGFAIETFLPSMRLKCSASADGKSQKCSAFWSDVDSFALLDSDGRAEPSTIEITRTMQREMFRPDTKIGMLSSFVHERIDLNVSIGRGRELIPLGIASIAITGDEENEVISNIPVKAATPEEVGWNYSLKNQKKKSYRLCFSDDPHLVYALEDNATLKVGVRVIPTKLMEQTDHYSSKPRRSTIDTIIKDSPDDDGHVFIELNDENSLIENLILTSYRSGISRNYEAATDNGTMHFPRTPETRIGGFFCAADDMALCHTERVCGTDRYSEKKSFGTKTPKSDNRRRSKKTSARIMSLSIMSDMSDSTTETEYDSVFSGIFQPHSQHRAEL